MFHRFPFMFRDFINTSTLEHLTRVTALVRGHSLAAGLGPEAIVIESMGTLLEQLDWSDNTGYFITFRPTPTYSSVVALRREVENLKVTYFEMFPGARKTEVIVDNDKVTLQVWTASYNIGD